MKNSNSKGFEILNIIAFKIFFTATLLLSCYTVSKCSSTPKDDTISVSHTDIVNTDHIDMGENLHICVDTTHTNCDGECSCDGMECEVK